MKKLILALVATAMLATPAVAAIEVEGDVYAGVYDKYMWRGFNLSASQPVLQMGTDISTTKFQTICIIYISAITFKIKEFDTETKAVVCTGRFAAAVKLTSPNHRMGGIDLTILIAIPGGKPCADIGDTNR